MRKLTSIQVRVILLIACAALAVSSCYAPPTIEPQPTITLPPPTPTPMPPGTALGFSTIDQEDDSTWPWYKGEPTLFVARNPEELADFVEYLSAEAQASLSTFDFNTNFVLAVFSGMQPTHGVRLSVREVRVHQNHVFVEGMIELPTWEVEQEGTSPYHVMQVEREGVDWETELTFVLSLTKVWAKNR